MDRRLFLAIIAGTVAAGRQAMATPAAPPLRRLKLYNAHTGETFDGPYRNDKGPIASAFSDLSVLLRDHYSGQKTEIDVGLIDFLAAVMTATGQDKATVLSAYRTPATNAMLARTIFGVAENSQHMYGRAIDVHFDTRLPDAMVAARAMKRGGVGWYPHSGFMHIDTGPVRNWELDQGGLGSLLFEGRRIAFSKKGEMVVTGPGRLIIGGGNPAIVIPDPPHAASRIKTVAKALRSSPPR
ncbi:MAG TPA: DUF882 domain-containing protein [Stellaceae bacterium]|nr:DUF882 domain-containing protein [Stellaceae bacterium]